MTSRFVSLCASALSTALALPLCTPAVAIAAAAATAPLVTAAPQKVARTFTEVPSQGFKFKPLADFDAVPVGGGGDETEILKFSKDRHQLMGYAFETPKAASKPGKDGEESDEGRSKATGKRRSIDPVLKRYIGFDAVADAPTLDEELVIDDVEVKRRRFEFAPTDGSGDPMPRFLEVWSFPLRHADIHLVYFADDEFDKRWAKAIETSGKSFKLIDRVALKEIDTSKRTYESQLAFAEQQAAKTPGWKAIGTPSKRFVILTNAEKKAFIKEVIKRLEVSRDVFEEDFPPPADFDAVSVVRICKDREEFQKFSGMGGGVAGYFSPQSVELVLYDDVETDRNMTYAVVSHEAFHQYCHFLFGQSEAHRWFDEGQGDYYGGMKKGKITPKMPAGLDRLSVIRTMIRTDKTVKLEEHLNYSHREWQAHGVPSYAQSWSIIYMLRRGMLGKVHRKVWNKEYADIIPNYVTTLTKGYRDFYAEIIDERRERAKKEGRELTPEEMVVNRFKVDPRRSEKAKAKIWKDAMDAAWGSIDLKEFEENWETYVMKLIK